MEGSSRHKIEPGFGQDNRQSRFLLQFCQFKSLPYQGRTPRHFNHKILGWCPE